MVCYFPFVRQTKESRFLLYGSKQAIFIALGSNIDPKTNLQKAADLLREHFSDIKFSSVYRTAAREVENQDDFLNAVAACNTEKSPEEIHGILKGIEESLGKDPPYRFGPRTIDLDLLLYGNSQFPAHRSFSGGGSILNSQLIIPHPRMHERRFVLEPLCELIDPHAKHSLLKQSWEDLLEKTLEQECVLTEIAL